MIKKIFILIIFLLVLTGVYSQNLVPNGSFENYLRIPLKPSQLNLAPPWQQLSNKGADYFHKGGFQIEKDSVKPFSGSGYAGFLALNAFENTKNNNEFISVKLKESLNASQKYHIEFYIYFSNLRDKNEDLSINNISAMFTLDSVFNDNKLRKLFAKKPTLFNNDNVQINTPNRWIKISGEFIGRGGEKYMTIGNFINDKDYDYVRTNNSKKKIKTPGHIRLYFYIDNIKVIPIDDFGKEITWNKNENINPIPNFLFQIGKSLVIDNIYFKSNSASLKETSFNELDMLFDNIIKLETYDKLEISGHTDNIGQEEDNIQLSEARAKAVAEYLIKKGIDKERIKSVGYGSNKSIATNDTKEGRVKNRRVELTIISKEVK